MCRLLFLLLLSGPALGQPAIPRVDEADWPAVAARCRALHQALRALEGALPPDADRRLAAVLKDGGKDALDQLQDVLDPLCLVVVMVNPESRVKAQRGPASAELTQARPRIVLVKVCNDAGITTSLAVDGDDLRRAGRPGGWLEAEIVTRAPLAATLSGQRVEYVVLRLTAREAGKREATLKFDAGQGTQDLGFRAEVPVLFRIAPR
jgi:hypothetical protein